MAEIIDYAGLFPPAGLPLDRAFRNFLNYLGGANRWMLARFVVPVHGLEALGVFSSEITAAGEPLRFSVLGTGGDDAASFVAAMEQDAETIASFHDAYPKAVVAEAMEVRLPQALLREDTAALESFLDDVHAIVARRLPPIKIFYEVPVGGSDARLFERCGRAVARHAEQQEERPVHPSGLKIRTGGLEPDAFPAVRDLARALTTFRDTGARFKATAGLHHPIRHRDARTGATAHGFFNVFGAAVLAHARDLNEDTIAEILADETAEHFRFSDEGLAWRDHHASVPEIASARSCFAVSFGSCSFDEPRQDLATLGLLEPAGIDVP